MASADPPAHHGQRRAGARWESRAGDTSTPGSSPKKRPLGWRGRPELVRALVGLRRRPALGMVLPPVYRRLSAPCDPQATAMLLAAVRDFVTCLCSVRVPPWAFHLGTVSLVVYRRVWDYPLVSLLLVHVFPGTVHSLQPRGVYTLRARLFWPLGWRGFLRPRLHITMSAPRETREGLIVSPQRCRPKQYPPRPGPRGPPLCFGKLG